MNPIYIEYYSHERELCYKINLPWAKYRQAKTVLCKVSEGYDLAKQRATEAIIKHLQESILIIPEISYIQEDTL